MVCVAAKFGLNAAHLADATKPLPAEPLREPAATEVPGVLLAARDRGEAP